MGRPVVASHSKLEGTGREGKRTGLCLSSRMGLQSGKGAGSDRRGPGVGSSNLPFSPKGRRFPLLSFSFLSCSCRSRNRGTSSRCPLQFTAVHARSIILKLGTTDHALTSFVAHTSFSLAISCQRPRDFFANPHLRQVSSGEQRTPLGSQSRRREVVGASAQSEPGGVERA